MLFAPQSGQIAHHRENFGANALPARTAFSLLHSPFTVSFELDSYDYPELIDWPLLAVSESVPSKTNNPALESYAPPGLNLNRYTSTLKIGLIVINCSRAYRLPCGHGRFLRFGRRIV